MILLCALALSFGNPTADAVFSSKDYADIFLPIWSYWHRNQDEWIVLISGDKRENQGISVYRWKANNPPELLTSTSAREGIFNVRLSAVSPSGDRLLIRGYSNPMVFELALNNPRRFKRSFLLELSDSLLFWDEQRILAGAKFPEIRFKVYGEGSQEIPLIASLIPRLPKKVDHPVEPIYYKNKMHVAKDGERLAVAFGLYESVTIWDGKKKAEHLIGFHDYVKPPWRKPKNTRRLREWFQNFHHLFHLTWFQGHPYGMFRKGYGDLGVWLQFLDGGSRLIWDNNKESIRIFAMERDGLVLGEKVLDTEEEVKWRLWQASSLP